MKLIAGLQGREFDRTAHIGVPAIHRIARAIGDDRVLNDLHLGNRRRLPQSGCGIDDRNAVERDAQRGAAGVTAVAAPTLIDAVDRDGVLRGARIAVAGDARARSESDHLRGAGHGSEHVHLNAVDHPQSLVRQEHVALRRLRRSA